MLFMDTKKYIDCFGLKKEEQMARSHRLVILLLVYVSILMSYYICDSCQVLYIQEIAK